MLFWITVILFAVSIGITIWICSELSYEYDWVSAISFVIAFLSGIAMVVMIAIMMTNHIGADANVEKMNTRYDMLTYQYENDVYDNDNDLGYRELMVDIQEWNEDLSYKKRIHDDLWLGIFYPDIYDQFDYIVLK